MHTGTYVNPEPSSSDTRSTSTFRAIADVSNGSRTFAKWVARPPNWRRKFSRYFVSDDTVIAGVPTDGAMGGIGTKWNKFPRDEIAGARVITRTLKKL